MVLLVGKLETTPNNLRKLWEIIQNQVYDIVLIAKKFGL
jgi:hypothetical protein